MIEFIPQIRPIYFKDQTAMRERKPHLAPLSWEDVDRAIAYKYIYNAATRGFSHIQGGRLLFTRWRIRTSLGESLGTRVIVEADPDWNIPETKSISNSEVQKEPLKTGRLLLKPVQ